MGNVEDSVLRRYVQYLCLERSYSKNTLDAYRRDLQKLLVFYADNHIDYRTVTLEQLDQFAGQLREEGIQARSVARILSGVRSFYRFLTLEKEVEQDPTELLESPQIGKHLPEVLSVEEIDSIINVIDVSKPEGIRDRAIIEVLYGCGLRISELCNPPQPHFLVLSAVQASRPCRQSIRQTPRQQLRHKPDSQGSRS